MIKTNFAVLMAERGLKIADVYEETGISKTTLMALAENTGKGVQFETVDKLCNFLGVELKDFFVYVPYIWDMYFKKNDEYKHSDYIVVKLKGKNSEKDYFLDVSAYDPKSYDFPLDERNVQLWLRVELESSDAYSDNDFFNFLRALPIPMKTHFFNQLFQTIRDSILSTNQKILCYNDEPGNNFKTYDDHFHEITLKEKDKVYILLFEGNGTDNKDIEETKILTI